MRARIFFTLVFLLTTFRLAAQDNPYEIDNNCYTWYQEAELLVGQEGFKEAGDQLLKAALEAGDKKAETLYYTLILKDRVKYPFTPENERNALEAADIQIVILSALNSQEDVVKGFNAGANDFIMKPIIMEKLLTCVVNQLGLVKK